MHERERCSLYRCVAVRLWIGDSGASGRLQHCKRWSMDWRGNGFAHHKIVFARHSLRPPEESFTSLPHFRQDAGALQDEAGHAEGPEGPAEDLGRQEPAPGLHLLRSQPRHHPRDLPKVGEKSMPQSCLRVYVYELPPSSDRTTWTRSPSSTSPIPGSSSCDFSNL